MSGFTHHANKRMKERRISYKEIQSNSSNSLKVIRSDDDGAVITAYRIVEPPICKLKGIGSFPFTVKECKKVVHLENFQLRRFSGSYIRKFQDYHKCTCTIDRVNKTIIVSSSFRHAINRALKDIDDYKKNGILPSFLNPPSSSLSNHKQSIIGGRETKVRILNQEAKDNMKVLLTEDVPQPLHEVRTNIISSNMDCWEM